MKLTWLEMRNVKEGERIPAWYYGLSYEEFDRAVCVFHPIPINYIMRFGRFLKHCWDRIRSRRGYVDRQIIKYMNELHQKHYDDIDRFVDIRVDTVFNVLRSQLSDAAKIELDEVLEQIRGLHGKE